MRKVMLTVDILMLKYRHPCLYFQSFLLPMAFIYDEDMSWKKDLGDRLIYKFHIIFYFEILVWGCGRLGVVNFCNNQIRQSMSSWQFWTINSVDNLISPIFRIGMSSMVTVWTSSTSRRELLLLACIALRGLLFRGVCIE